MKKKQKKKKAPSPRARTAFSRFASFAVKFHLGQHRRSTRSLAISWHEHTVPAHPDVENVQIGRLEITRTTCTQASHTHTTHPSKFPGRPGGLRWRRVARHDYDSRSGVICVGATSRRFAYLAADLSETWPAGRQ